MGTDKNQGVDPESILDLSQVDLRSTDRVVSDYPALLRNTTCKHILNHLAERVHKANQTWWHDPVTGERLDRNKGEMIALMHSELSEMMEGERKSLMDDHLPHRRMAEVELADLIIRALDYSGGFGYDLGGAFEEKLAYNDQRADHKPENRVLDNGKKW